MYSMHLFKSFQFYNAVCKMLSRLQYFSSLHFPIANEIIQKCTKGKVLFTTEQHGSVYIINPDVANQISSCIAKEWNGGYLLEANPGPGLLSSYLLQNGVKHLRVFEKQNEFISVLKVLAAESSPSIEIIQQDLMLLAAAEFRKNSDSPEHVSYAREFFQDVFKNIPKQPWENGTSFQMFSVIANRRSSNFLRYLLVALPNKSTLFSFGRCDFFFLICESEYMYMKAMPKDNLTLYRWSTVLYNIFFEIKCLQKFPSNAKNFYFCRASKKIANNKHFYLVKMTPKRDLYAHPMTQEKLQDFAFFVRFHLAKRSDLVIKAIEHLIPFCGPRLIKEGLNVFTKFGDLNPTEILRLFNCISSWPEYQNCNLQKFASKFNKSFTKDGSDGVE